MRIVYFHGLNKKFVICREKLTNWKSRRQDLRTKQLRYRMRDKTLVVVIPTGQQWGIGDNVGDYKRRIRTGWEFLLFLLWLSDSSIHIFVVFIFHMWMFQLFLWILSFVHDTLMVSLEKKKIFFARLPLLTDIYLHWHTSLYTLKLDEEDAFRAV